MSAPEFSRLIKARPLPAGLVEVEASEAERAALADRFGIISIGELKAEVSLEERKAAICAIGTLEASVTQSCAVSGEDFPVSINEKVDLRFVRESALPANRTEDGEIEIELSIDDGDEIEFSGEAFDLGEAIAQTLGLAIDPYAEGPNAVEARKKAGIVAEGEQGGPMAEALAALKKT